MSQDPIAELSGADDFAELLTAQGDVADDTTPEGPVDGAPAQAPVDEAAAPQADVEDLFAEPAPSAEGLLAEPAPVAEDDPFAALDEPALAATEAPAPAVAEAPASAEVPAEAPEAPAEAPAPAPAPAAAAHTQAAPAPQAAQTAMRARAVDSEDAALRMVESIARQLELIQAAVVRVHERVDAVEQAKTQPPASDPMRELPPAPAAAAAQAAPAAEPAPQAAAQDPFTTPAPASPAPEQPVAPAATGQDPFTTPAPAPEQPAAPAEDPKVAARRARLAAARELAAQRRREAEEAARRAAEQAQAERDAAIDAALDKLETGAPLSEADVALLGEEGVEIPVSHPLEGQQPVVEPAPAPEPETFAEPAPVAEPIAAEPAPAAEPEPFAIDEPAPADDDLGDLFGDGSFEAPETGFPELGEPEPAPAADEYGLDDVPHEAPLVHGTAAFEPAPAAEPETFEPAPVAGEPDWDEAGEDFSHLGDAQVGYDEPAAPVAEIDAEPMDAIWAVGIQDAQSEEVQRQTLALDELRRQAKRSAPAKRGRGGAVKLPRLPLSAVGEGQPLVLAVFSPKGGAGKSTTSVNMGALIAASAAASAPKGAEPKRVLVMDGDIANGNLAIRVAGRLEPNLLEMVDWIDQNGELTEYDAPGANTASMRDFVLYHPDLPNLNILAAPANPDAFDDFTVEDYERILKMLGRFYDVIILDCGTEIVMRSNQTWLRHAHQVFMLTLPERAALHSAGRAARLITKAGPDRPMLVTPDKLNLVMMRSDADLGFDPQYGMRETFPWADEAHTFYFRDYDLETAQANNRGEFLSLANPDYAKDISALVVAAFANFQAARSGE